MSIQSKRFILVLFLLKAGLVLAADWKSSFTAKELSPFIDTEAVVLVVGAGTPPAEARSAARALEGAARSRARLVMDSAPLGTIAPNTNDETIRQNAAALPWSHLAIVRVFPSRSSFTAVVVIYDKTGTVRASLTANPGELAVAQATSGGMTAAELEGLPSTPPVHPEPSSAPPPMVSDGSTPTAAAPPPVDVVTESPPADARRIHFGPVPQRNWASVAFDGALQGNKRLSTEQLYEALGRRDLLAARSSRAGLKLGLGLGAAAAFLGAAAGACIPQGAFGGWCQPQLEGVVISASAGAVGLGLLVVALVLPSEPVSAGELLKIIEKHNAGLSSDESGGIVGGITSIEIVPAFDARGGGSVQLVAKF